ncbi:SAM-dependent methyltransferase [Rhizobium sp. BK529]|uniref:class I SAM-dependent methyltransferase n=1 Tax=unclassified Rhizobium TaxID=2613769 RepID=UPI001051310B|nr:MULTISPECIES: class I SAM-dependent methyltransferase [unclassified Rhizobium]MBB3595363.1 SAM-dependent methyltransferase [Rhizobium sp. BK529]TCS00844.1 methyltransferase family protein [Rhizobium sp. BK418]
MADDRKLHWENVYSTKGETDVSWFQESPSPSLELIHLAQTKQSDAIVDIGGGASRLVDSLLAEGFRDVTVLDLSEAALDTARKRLGAKGDEVKWIAADATLWEPPLAYDIWHDRAAFHFLTDETQQTAYIERLKRGLKFGGHLIMGTFAPDGPEKCSGLPVARHSPDSLGDLLGAGFKLIDSRRHDHSTPWESVQKFQFSTFKRIA